MISASSASLNLRVRRLAAIEEEILDELLRQRRAALHDVSGHEIRPRRAQDRNRIDAVVMLEVAILDRLQPGDEQRRHFGELHDAAIFLERAIQRRDARRFEAHLVERGAAVRIDELGDAAIGERDRDALLALAPVEIDEAAPRDREARAVARISARILRSGILDVPRGIELELEDSAVIARPGASCSGRA